MLSSLDANVPMKHTKKSLTNILIFKLGHGMSPQHYQHNQQQHHHHHHPGDPGNHSFTSKDSGTGDSVPTENHQFIGKCIPHDVFGSLWLIVIRFRLILLRLKNCQFIITANKCPSALPCSCFARFFFLCSSRDCRDTFKLRSAW